jgi:hypothetical protein
MKRLNNNGTVTKNELSLENNACKPEKRRGEEKKKAGTKYEQPTSWKIQQRKS